MSQPLYPLQKELTLAEDALLFRGIRMIYRLSACESPEGISYRLTVTSREESRTEEVGCDLLRAARLFQIVTRGFVSPCTLSDVLSDLEVEEGW